MRKIILLYFFFACTLASVFSQQYFGRQGQLSLSGIGTTSTTTLETTLTSTNLDIAAPMWAIQVKMDVFQDPNNNAKMAILSDVFNYQTNRVLKISFSPQSLNANVANSFSVSAVSVPCTLSLGGQSTTTTAIVTLNHQLNDKITMSLSIPALNIQQLGLTLGTHNTDFSSIINIQLNNWILNKRM